MRGPAAARRSIAELDELPGLHDGRQTPAILSEHANVLGRISVNDQDVRAAAGLDFTEVRLHQNLGIYGGCRPQDGGGRLHFPPDAEFARLMSVEMPKKVRSKAHL